jgi:integrase
VLTAITKGVESHAPVSALPTQMAGSHRLVASLLDGIGMHLLEGLRLRVQDIDFAYQRIHVHQAKASNDRCVPFPANYVNDLRSGLRRFMKSMLGILPLAVARSSYRVHFSGGFSRAGIQLSGT